MRKRSRKLARLRITTELIKELIKLPDECDIRHISVPADTANILSLIIEHPYFNELQEGEMIPLIDKEEINNAGYET